MKYPLSIIRLFFIIFFITISQFKLFSQIDTAFWFAAPYINCNHGRFYSYQLVLFSFEQEATVTISMPADPSFSSITTTIGMNDYKIITLARTKADGDMSITSEFNKKQNRGLFIKATSKIECYYQITGDNSEAFTLKGKNALGTHFIVTGQNSYDNGNNNGDYIGARNSVHIVATEDNTTVTFTPSNYIYGTGSKDPITITLNRGQTYSIAAATYQARYNLVGTIIQSDKPIAVTYNDDSVFPGSLDIYSEYGCGDDIGEQLLSTDYAGTKFVIVSPSNNQLDRIIYFALEDNTVVTTSTGNSQTLNKGRNVTITMPGASAMSISATKPIMVFQVISSVNPSCELGGTVVPAIDCSGSHVAGYKSYNNTSSTTIYFNIVTLKKNISNFTINNSPILASEFHAVDDNDDYYYARIERWGSSRPFIIECSSGKFHLGASEGNEANSSTYGFFSDFAASVYDEYSSVPTDRDFTWRGHYQLDDPTSPIIYSDEGIYFDTLVDQSGCDSICVVHFSRFPYPDNVEEESSCKGEFENSEWGMKADYLSDTIMSPLVLPLVGDINDDDTTEILCFAPNAEYSYYGVNKIYIINSITKRIKDSITINNAYGKVYAQSAGVWGMVKLPNGHTMLVVTTYDDIFSYLLGYELSNSSNSHKWEATLFPPLFANVGFADFNNDGNPEVYIGNRIYDAENGNLLVSIEDGNAGKSFAHGKFEWEMDDSHPVYSSFATDIEGDGNMELIAGNEIYKITITNRSGTDGNGSYLYKTIAPPEGVERDGHTQVADFNLDGSLDVLISTKPYPNNCDVSFYVWDVRNNRTSAAIKIPNRNSESEGKGFPLIADIDTDGVPEVIIQSDTENDANKYQAYKYDTASHRFSLLWSFGADEDSYSTTMTAFDFNHDSILELVLLDRSSIRLLNGSGKSHKSGNDTMPIYSLTSFPFGTYTTMQYPLIADIDKDGSAEIIAIGQTDHKTSYNGSLAIFSSATKPWMPARSVWNQYMYNAFNINSDLTIPSQYHYSNAMELSEYANPSMIRRPYNNFFQQMTTIDKEGKYVNRVADVNVESINQERIPQYLKITVKYSNIGKRDLVAPYTITTYANADKDDILAIDTIMQTLAIGNNAEHTIFIPHGVWREVALKQQIVVCINDAGEGIAQEDHQQPECDITNNTLNNDFPEITSDITDYPLSICENELPYTHEESGITFPKGTASKKDTCQTYVSQLGNDSVVHVVLTILPPLFGDTTDYKYTRRDYTWHDKTFTTAGDYTDTLVSLTNGCDSVVTLHLMNFPVDTTPLYDTICETDLPYLHSSSGIEFPIGFQSDDDSCTTLITSYGHDSVLRVKLTIHPTLYGDTLASKYTRRDYTWHDKTFTTAGDYTDTLVSLTNGCDSVVTLHLTNFPVDTTPLYDTICETDLPYLHSSSGIEFPIGFQSDDDSCTTLITSYGHDSVLRVKLTIHPTLYGDTLASMYEGRSFVWHGNTYSEPSNYRDTVFSTITGCDSIVTLHLTTTKIEYSIFTHAQCADDPYVDFEVSAPEGLFDQLQFSFSPEAIAQHFRDTLVSFAKIIQIPNSARAGVYDVAILPIFENKRLDSANYSYTLLYPSSVLDQHWDNFIGVLTHNYNGGYDFESFQWYKNGDPILGENHSYTYQTIEMGARYSVLLKEKDGTELMTCEIIAKPQTYISLYPTFVRPHQKVKLRTTEDITVWIYNSIGTLVFEDNFESGEHSFTSPHVVGVYIIKIQPIGQHGKSETKKMIVR